MRFACFGCCILGIADNDTFVQPIPRSTAAENILRAANETLLRTKNLGHMATEIAYGAGDTVLATRKLKTRDKFRAAAGDVGTGRGLLSQLVQNPPHQFRPRIDQDCHVTQRHAIAAKDYLSTGKRGGSADEGSFAALQGQGAAVRREIAGRNRQTITPLAMKLRLGDLVVLANGW